MSGGAEEGAKGEEGAQGRAAGERGAGREAREGRVALLLAYDGTGYAGWQVQPGVPTVQGLVRDALAPLVEGGRLPVGASRTDAGVHALGQVATVDGVRAGLAPTTLRAALNARLPPEVRVLATRAVRGNLDARRSARLKRYGYLIARQAVLSPFLRRYTWHLPGPLDAARMAAALAPLRGRHDFSAFRAAAGRDRDPHCTVRAIRVVERGPFLAVAVSADAFLHHMVRNVVGSAVEIGRRRRPPDWLGALLTGRDRRQAGVTAPAHGLFLLSVRYPQALFPGRARQAGPADTAAGAAASDRTLPGPGSGRG